MRLTYIPCGLIVSASLLFGCEKGVDTEPSSPSGTGGSGGQSQGGGGSSGSHCPTVNLGSTLPISYSGSTVGKPNIVTSTNPELEWGDAGDDALLFVAPTTATYGVTAVVPIGSSCNASIRENGPNMDGTGDIYDSSWCPAEGSATAIDGVTAGGSVDLEQGQEMLVWVSCAQSAEPNEDTYDITIFQQ